MDGFYLPHIKQTLRLSTHRTYENIWNFHLEARIGDVRLRDFTTYDGELLLQNVARQNDIAKATLKQIKAVISAIFKQAKRLKFVLDNPMRDVSIPNAKAHGRESGIYDLGEIKQILTVLTGVEPARTIVAVAAFSGLRRGEIRGLEWQHYKGNALDIQQSVYLGEVGAPKSEASRALVPCILPLKKNSR